MGRLAGFRYRDIVRRLKHLGFVFERQAAGSHEIWSNSNSGRYTTIPNHPGDMPVTGEGLAVNGGGFAGRAYSPFNKSPAR